MKILQLSEQRGKETIPYPFFEGKYGTMEKGV